MPVLLFCLCLQTKELVAKINVLTIWTYVTSEHDGLRQRLYEISLTPDSVFAL